MAEDYYLERLTKMFYLHQTKYKTCSDVNSSLYKSMLPLATFMLLMSADAVQSVSQIWTSLLITVP